MKLLNEIIPRDVWFRFVETHILNTFDGHVIWFNFIAYFTGATLLKSAFGCAKALSFSTWFIT